MPITRQDSTPPVTPSEEPPVEDAAPGGHLATPPTPEGRAAADDEGEEA